MIIKGEVTSRSIHIFDIKSNIKKMDTYLIINKNKKFCFRMCDDRYLDLIFESEILKQKFDLCKNKIKL
ncbi:hypothetical protein [Paraclostridium sp.]|uniref:hypothetical protein n=1 Tax=Paraclostridium sp. TaxID=2023273 RepID=UPI003F670FC1